MKLGKAHGYLREFAPKEVLVLGQLGFFLLAIFLSSRTQTPLYFVVPNLAESLIAILVGFSIALFSKLIAKVYTPWADTLTWMFARFSGKYWLWWTFFAASLVSLGEETFFRGFLQPNIGLLPATFVFSLYHIRANLKALLVILFAFVFGLVFGYSYLVTGNLVVPILMHFAVFLFAGLFYQWNNRAMKQ